MRLSLSAAELFLAHLAGEVPLFEVLNHEAYRVIFAHAARYSGGLDAGDVAGAIRGEFTEYYGLNNLQNQLGQINELIEIIRSKTPEWLLTAEKELQRLCPTEDLQNLMIYPVIGYDMGIGLLETVCMNLNAPAYFESPDEFLYYIIHEAFHAIYERSHRLPTIEQVQTSADWRSFVNLFLQNEGYAVYAPWRLREERGHLADPDYQVLTNSGALQKQIAAYLDAQARWERGELTTPEEFSAVGFSRARHTYRVGAALIRQIEEVYGFAEVQKAVYLTGDEFVQRYQKLLQFSPTNS